MPSFNSILQHIQPSASMKRGLVSNPESFFNFAIGQPDIEPPAEVLDILKNRTLNGKYPYTQTPGSQKARENLAHLLSNEIHQVNLEEVILCDGAKFGIYISLLAVCNRGDKVLVLEPYWLSYPHILTALDLKMVSYAPNNKAGQLEYDTEKIIEVALNQGVKAIILNNPNNPSGQILPLEVIQKLVQRCEENGIWVVLDEVYIELVYDQKNRIATSFRARNLIRVGSFSKSLCVPGLRAGYMVAQPESLQQILLLMQHTQTCVNSFALSLVENISKSTLLEHSAMCSKTYQARFQVLHSLFSEAGIPVLPVSSSFYAFADFSHVDKDSEKSCDWLSDKWKVISTPGHEYGQSFSSYVRICLTLPENEILKAFSNLQHANI